MARKESGKEPKLGPFALMGKVLSIEVITDLGFRKTILIALLKVE